MHIGELARRATVNIQTIRFYEREGLMPAPSRNSSGYRCYEFADLKRVGFIKRNQELGFSLIEIRQLMDLHRTVSGMAFPLRRKPAELQAIVRLGRERLETIDEKLHTLTGIREQLAKLLRQLESPSVSRCPASSRQAKS
jgi:DNA-binding transcriptional MerR regulator